MKLFRSFWKNSDARIPFAILGIFLLLGSSWTTVYYLNLKTKNAYEISQLIDTNELELLLHYAEADISTALNMAGVKALKNIGENPVIISKDPSINADEINRNRLKQIILDELNVYLTSNYLYNQFNNGQYAVNIIIDENKFFPLLPRDISLETIKMTVTRPFQIPFISPDENKVYPVYWKITLPLNIEIVKLSPTHDNIIATRSVTISTVVTSRYPLLESLVNEFNETLNGVNSLWTVTTILSNLYSLARGYQQYSTGKPFNVVDNHHLAPLVNTGILLEEGLIFGSIDPMALVDLSIQCEKTLRGRENQSSVTIFNQMNSSEYVFSVSDFYQVNTNAHGETNEPASIDDCLHINLSEIAERILYEISSVLLIFRNEKNETITWELFNPQAEELQNVVEKYLSKGYCFTNIKKGITERNQSTLAKIDEIISQVYTATLQTQVKRDPCPSIHLGEHEGFPVDNGTGPWILDSFELKKTEGKPPKGSVTPGCVLYKENYDVYWRRTHYWGKKTVENSNGTTKVNWTIFIATDYKKEENVSFQILLDSYAEYEELENDVCNVFYRDELLNDENLADTLYSYKHMVFTPHFNDLLVIKDGCYYPLEITGHVEPWVQREAWETLNELLTRIKSIQQSSQINITNYPNPIDLLNAVEQDLLEKYSEHTTDFLNISIYQNRSFFKSVGKKAVYCVRYWYVTKVKEEIQRVFSNVITVFNQRMEEALPSDQDVTADEVTNVLSSSVMETLKNQFTLPIGFELTLKRNDGSHLGWNESICLAVDHFPNYLDPFHKVEYNGKKEYWLGIRNTCLLGPTGVPILPPSPATPWIVTMNTWLIDVKGRFAEFKLIDGNDETIFNPLFGHEPQVYMRSEKQVRDENGNIIGYNTYLKFEFSTVSFSLVPPWRMMVGDKTGGIQEKHGLSFSAEEII